MEKDKFERLIKQFEEGGHPNMCGESITKAQAKQIKKVLKAKLKLYYNTMIKTRVLQPFGIDGR